MDSDLEFVLIISTPNYSSRCYRLQEDHIKIGRGRSCDLTLDNPAISSSHCEFAKDGKSGKWKFRDLESTNGSKSNGRRVTSDGVPVRDGDQILLGEEVRILFCELREIESRVVEEEDPDMDVNPVAAAVARQVREDQLGGQTVRLDDKS